MKNPTLVQQTDSGDQSSKILGLPRRLLHMPHRPSKARSIPKGTEISPLIQKRYASNPDHVTPLYPTTTSSRLTRHIATCPLDSNSTPRSLSDRTGLPLPGVPTPFPPGISQSDIPPGLEQLCSPQQLGIESKQWQHPHQKLDCFASAQHSLICPSFSVACHLVGFLSILIYREALNPRR
ncbi:hypothetical protein BDZ45DRAFT_267008 [Acephala macrosclerotiorum]|nr:hypothetical protein BDZ45DRAFT_267008 [Acephala macrosclerotiorum]